MKAFNFYEKGLLPNGTIWREESEKFLGAMTIIENKRADINEDINTKRKNRK